MKSLFKDGTMFMITYTPQTIGGEVNKDKKHITRRGKWDMKCKFNENYILYFDRDRGNLDMRVINFRLFIFLSD